MTRRARRTAGFLMKQTPRLVLIAVITTTRRDLGNGRIVIATDERGRHARFGEVVKDWSASGQNLGLTGPLACAQIVQGG